MTESGSDNCSEAQARTGVGLGGWGVGGLGNWGGQGGGRSPCVLRPGPRPSGRHWLWVSGTSLSSPELGSLGRETGQRMA